MNIALILSYDGTAYHGWQIQKNGMSIQQAVTDAIQKLLGCKVSLSGVGRTDAGVHARQYVANFHADCTIPLDRLPLALNAQLAGDISISAAVQVPEHFDARFQCARKEYAYYVYASRLPDPFLAGRAYRHHYPLNVKWMQQAAGHFIGKHDFAAVRSMGTPVKSTVRTIFHCTVETCPAPGFTARHTDETSPLIRIRVCGDGFLYNMVRAIAGTLIYAGSGKIAPEDIPDILKSGQRSQAGPTLPACGLYLNRLWYPDTPELAPYWLDT